MPPGSHWTDHSGGQWQQAEIRTEMLCKPNNDDDFDVSTRMQTEKINLVNTAWAPDSIVMMDGAI